MFTEDGGGVGPGKGIGPAEAGGDLGDDPPIGPGLARGGEEGALAADHPLAIGDGAVLLAPAQSGEADAGGLHRVGIGHAIAGDQAGDAGQGGADIG